MRQFAGHADSRDRTTPHSWRVNDYDDAKAASLINPKLLYAGGFADYANMDESVVIARPLPIHSENVKRFGGFSNVLIGNER